MRIQTVSVSFMSGNAQGAFVSKEYEYLTNLNAKVGDVAIVDSPGDGYVTVKVKRVSEGAIGKATKFLVQLVDDTAYKVVAGKYAERKEIIKQLESRKRQVEEEQVWKWLAANDSEAAELLKRLKEF